MRLVEELAQGLDVDVLVPAHHEDAGGAGRCIPAACKVGSRQGSAAGPGPTRSGPELSRDPGPTSAVEPRLAHQHLSGAPLEAQLPGGRVGAGHHLREGAAGASGRTGHLRDPPPGPPPSPHHQRRLHVHLLHAPNRARLPLSRRPRRGCPSRCLPPPAGARPRLLLSAAARGEAPGGLPPPPGPHRGSSAGLGAGAGGARPGCAEGSARPRRGGSGLRGGEAGLRGGWPG